MSEEFRPVLYSGTGNTFALIDARRSQPADRSQLARALCERLDVDGLLVMEPSTRGDIRMRIVNRDGSEADMCGNGSRCAAYWAHHEAGIKPQMQIETNAGMLKAEVLKGGSVRIRLTDPHSWCGPMELDLEGKRMTTYSINTGVPHAVVTVEDVATVPVDALGRKIRFHELFKPAGTNVSFMRRTPSGIEVRTYERGVEGETKSCGTGSTACALVASVVWDLASPVEVLTASREYLHIYFKKSGKNFSEVDLEGPVTELKKSPAA